MKSRKKISIVLLFTMIYTLICGFDIKLDEEKNRVLDEVGYLSEGQRKSLQEHLTKKSVEAQLDIVFYIGNEEVSNDAEDEALAEDIYDSNGFGYDNGGSGVMLYINLNSRYAYICTTGIAIWCIDDYDIEDILDDIWSEIEYGDYYEAAKYFADDVTIISKKYLENEDKGIEVWRENEYTVYEDFYYDYAQHHRDVDYTLEDSFGEVVTKILKNPIACGFVGAVISGIIVLIMCLGQKSKMKANGNTYMDRNQYVVNEREDRYLRTTTVKTKIESSSGGGGGGSFSGNHGGGGRHF